MHGGKWTVGNKNAARHSNVIMDNPSKIRNFKDLRVWQIAHELALFIYRISNSFPREELYGITSQLRRAATSTAANIAEGSKRRTTNDFCHFLKISEGSNEELKYFLLLAKDLCFLNELSFNHANNMSEQIGAMLYCLIQSLKK